MSSEALIQQPLPYGQVLRTREYKVKEGLAGVFSQWGNPRTCEAMLKAVERKYGEGYNPGDTGFRRVFRYPAGFPEAHGIEVELEAAAANVRRVLELNRWEPRSVRGIFFGTDAPPLGSEFGLSYAIHVADRAGLGHLTENDIYDYYLACNGGARAIREGLHPILHPELQGERVIAGGHSGMLRLATTLDPRLIDGISPQIFTLGGAAIGFIPGQTLSLIEDHDGKPLETVVEIEDKDSALAGTPPYNYLYENGGPLDPDGPVVQKIGNASFVRMPPPRQKGRVLDMQPQPTTLFFARHTTEVAQEAITDIQVKRPDVTIHELVPHHANEKLLELVTRMLAKKGIKIRYRWSLRNGNPPPAATMAAFLKRMNDLQGKNALFGSFGGGASFDFFPAYIGTQ